MEEKLKMIAHYHDIESKWQQRFCDKKQLDKDRVYTANSRRGTHGDADGKNVQLMNSNDIKAKYCIFLFLGIQKISKVIFRYAIKN